MVKLFVIAGHGGRDCGAAGYGYTEAERVRALAKKIKEYGGDQVLLGDLSKDYYSDKLINKLPSFLSKGTQVLELHMDGSVSTARGGHVIILSDPDDYDRKLSKMISTVLPGRSQILVERNDLYNMNRCANLGYPYRLMECGFITNKDDLSVFNSNIDKIAIETLKIFGIKRLENKTMENGVNTVRRLCPGSAHVYCEAPVKDKNDKVMFNAKKGDHVTILDHGTVGVKVRYNKTEGFMYCKHIMPDFKKGDRVRLVEDVTITLKKGTVLTSCDGGYLGNRLNGEFVVSAKSYEKVE